MPAKVLIPGLAINYEKDRDAADDVAAPTAALLQELNLLGRAGQGGGKDDFERATGLASVFTGPPASVAILEAGATAFAKWWAAGAGAAIAAIWTTVGVWWGKEPLEVRVGVVGGAALVTAALVLAIGLVIASDIRGRAQGQTAIIQTRQQVAIAMIEAARAAYTPPVTHQIIPLPGLNARNHGEDGWVAIAMDYHDGANPGYDYIVRKGNRQQTVPPEEIEINPLAQVILTER